MQKIVALLFVLSFSSLASAEVLSAGRSNFLLAHEATSSLAPEEVWDRLMEPAAWWDGEHTYSGDAANLSMGGKAGDYWREDWDGGSVIHGQILTVKTGETLVLSAPFGPLQGTAANCVWTISLEPIEGGGTRIRSKHVVVGPANLGMQELAEPVDFVMSNGIDRLARAEPNAQ